MLMRESALSKDLLCSISNCIQDNRQPYLIHHTLQELISQRVFQIAAGYEDADDCDSLRGDSILKLCSGCSTDGEDLGSQPTMTRLENKVSNRELYKIALEFVHHFVSSYDKEPESIILDCDDSNANTYGGQQLSLFNAYYGEYCYMPLFIFEGISGKMILPILRPGRGNKSLNIFNLLRRLVEELRKFWKHTTFILRGDSHFCSHEFMDWAMDKTYVHFITGLGGNSVLLRKVEEWVKSAEKSFKYGGVPVKTYRTFHYKAGSWKNQQRVIVKVEVAPWVRIFFSNTSGFESIVLSLQETNKKANMIDMQDNCFIDRI